MRIELEKRFAIFKKRIHLQLAPAGWVSSFEIATDQILFQYKTKDEAEKYIQEHADEIEPDENFFEIKEVYAKYIYP